MNTNGIPEIAPQELAAIMDKVTLIDVRQPEEFVGELSHIPKAQLVPLGQALDTYLTNHKNKDEQIVFVCRSGARSGRATTQSMELGFTNTINLQGGMILWNNLNLPVAGGK
ncbi:rhodanese-like domain-containing protein [Bdellovibrio sp. NC01]|uniref:rhodanese-like domain-containing protein n=1 Tax=Bdellovibrio sp. NC01 TaxID=2220073 RepID=UPI001159B655|nr:rhodanese-like domain-containing protein [Bdellovibrio sp. NC01]QDK39350.1 rhodanese-like domain-containing protein [Bdellovibrio sp. NC01]